jgi:hypothetical protein
VAAQRAWWSEIARVLAPGGTYLSQEVGPASVFELIEFFLGPLPREGRDPEKAREMDLDGAGFTVAEYRPRLRELHDRITAEGPFVAHSSRFLIEARKAAR